MDETILMQLQQRYGADHNYSVLTQQQQDLLMDPRIAQNSNVTGGKTVQCRGIETTNQRPILSLLDVFSYTFHRENKGPITYANERSSIYDQLLETRRVHGQNSLVVQRRRWELSDAVVEVEFATLKDRA